MPAWVNLNSPRWQCVRAVSMRGGCATLNCPTGQVCPGTAQIDDLRHQDRIGQPLPTRIRVYDAAQQILLGAGFAAAETVPALELVLRAELAAAGASTHGTQMVDRFMRGTGGTLTHGPGSTLTALALGAGNLASYVVTAVTAIKTKIKNQIASVRTSYELDPGDLPWVSFPIAQAAPGMPSGMRTMAAVIGGTKGNKVFVRNLAVNTANRNFSFGLRVEVCDHFGVDETDLYSPGLIAFWKLQHARAGVMAPFVNLIVHEQGVSGTV